MPRKRAIPAGAVRRQCPICHQFFGPMTDALFEVNWRQHITMSERHKRYLALAARQVLERAGRGNPPMPGDEWPS